MAKFDVDVGGVTYEVEAPDENTAWEWANYTHRQSPKPKRDIAAEIKNDPITRGAMEAADPKNRPLSYEILRQIGLTGRAGLTGTGGEVIANKLGLPQPENFAERIAQSASSTMAGTAGIAGGAKALSEVARGISKPILEMFSANLPAQLTGAAGSGLAMESAKEAGVNPLGQFGAGLAGGFAGGVVPQAVGSLAQIMGRTGYRLLEPMIPSRGDFIKGREFLRAADTNKLGVLQELDSPKSFVSGTLPNTGEAAASARVPKLAALQESARRILPEAYNSRIDANNSAILKSIGGVAEDAAFANPVLSPMRTAELIRDANARNNYGAIADRTVKTSSPQSQAIMMRPSVDDAIKDAARSAAERGGYFPAKGNPYSVENLQRIKMALDDLIAKPETFGIKATEAKEIGNTRQEFIDMLSRAVPEWNAARQQYAKDSIPINQMRIGQYLSDQLMNTPQPYQAGAGMPLNERGFLQAMRSSTDVSDTTAAQRAADLILSRAGVPRGNLSEIMGPKMGVLNDIKDDILRRQLMQSQAKTGAQVAPNILDVATRATERSTGHIPNLLDRTMTLSRAALNMVQGRANERLAKEMAQDMLYPSEVARQMRLALAEEEKRGTRDRLLRPSLKFPPSLAAQLGIEGYGILGNQDNKGILSER
jgi:hypothetical protein